jgi:lipopolysaccharide transport system permease protein
LHPLARLTGGLFRHHYLISQFVRRDVLLKYRGSFLGIGWSFLYPLLLLAAFTLVFGGVLGARWGGQKSHLELALFIYCGLVVFTPFAEIASTTPRLLQANQVYVKKILFPTEILPLIALLSASVHACVNLFILVAAVAYSGQLHATALLLPIILLPVWLLTLGAAWFLAAAGCFVRDLIHIMPVLTQLLLFLSPVFYPADVAPPLLRELQQVSPLAVAIQDTRAALLDGTAPHWDVWLAMLITGMLVAALGYLFFRRCKEEFADVL